MASEGRMVDVGKRWGQEMGAKWQKMEVGFEIWVQAQEGPTNPVTALVSRDLILN